MDDEAGDEGYTIDAGLIVRAWQRFRPVTSEDESHF